MEDLRNQAEAAERSAKSARKDLHIMLGTWVDDCVGTSGGGTSAGEPHVSLDLQPQSVLENVIRSYMRSGILPCNYFLSVPL